MVSQRTVPRIILYITAFGALVLGAFLIATAAIPFDWIKPHIDALSVDGDAEKFTREIFTRIAQRTFWGGLFLIIIGLLALWKRIRLQRQLEALVSQLTQSSGELLADFKRAIGQILAQNRMHVLLLGSLLLIGIAFRLAFLFQPIRHDEAFTFTNYASKPLILALSNYSFPNNHLFHTFWVHLSYTLFGNQLWAIRLPAFSAGVLILPFTYLLVHALYNRHAALIALGLTASASAPIEYATNARGYTLIGLCFLLICLLALYLQRKNNLAGWVLFSFISALGFYTIPIMLYPFAGVTLWIAGSIWANDFSSEKRPGTWLLVRMLCMTSALAGILYAPVMLGSGIDALIGNRFVQSTSTISFFYGLPARLQAVWHQWTRDLPSAAVWILGLSALEAFLLERRQAAHKIPFATAIALGLLVCLMLQTVLPPPRVWLYLLPLFFGLAGMGLDVCVRKIAPQTHRPTVSLSVALILPVICGLGAYQTLTQYYPYGPGTLRDAETIALDLQPQFQPHDRLLTIATAAPLEYYFLKHRIPIHYLRRPIQDASRIILIVLEKKYTLEQVQNFVQWPKSFTPPTLLKAYPSARLYLLRADSDPTQ